MENIWRRAGSLLAASVSHNTSAVYRTALSAFNRFRVLHHLNNAWPVPVGQFILFIAHCFERGCAASTITTYMSGLSFYHKLHGWNDPLEVFVIRKLLEGCKRSRVLKDARAPITQVLLTKIIETLPQICSSDYETILFQTVYSVAFYGLFRVSELVYTGSASTPLFIRDVVVQGDNLAVTFTLRTSKTSNTPVTLRVPREGDISVCPVRLLVKYLLVRPVSEGNLFLHVDSRPLSRSQFSAVLNKTIKKLGLHSSQFKSHSFRIGRATQLAIQGVPDKAIQQMGRWRSDCYKSYIRKSAVIKLC